MMSVQLVMTLPVCAQQDLHPLVIDHVALAKQGDNVLGSVRTSVRPSVRPPVRPPVCALTAEPFDLLPSATQSKEESLSVESVCLCVE